MARSDLVVALAKAGNAGDRRGADVSGPVSPDTDIYLGQVRDEFVADCEAIAEALYPRRRQQS